MFNIKFYTQIKVIFFLFFYPFLDKKFKEFIIYLINNYKFSHSQIFQDIFVYFFSNFKNKGFFIEIGGADGINISNTYLLEKKFYWTGIISEPNPLHKLSNLKNRKAILDTNIIDHKDSKKKIFYISNDSFNSSVKKNKKYKRKISLRALSLNSLLKKYKSPKNIDYISIDTEGSEYDILKEFNFKKYKVNIFTIEHNFNILKRNNILKIMERNNYIRIFKNLSYMDDWYIKKNLKI
jgi:FkbM family methyltransferase